MSEQPKNPRTWRAGDEITVLNRPSYLRHLARECEWNGEYRRGDVLRQGAKCAQIGQAEALDALRREKAK